MPVIPGTSAGGSSYATLAELKTRLGSPAGADDAALQNALDSVSRGIDRCCDRQFNNAGTVSARLFYPDTPYRAEVDDFSTSTGVIVQTDDGGDGTYSTTWVASTDYQLEPLNTIVDGESGWPYFVITAVGGRTFPTLRHRAASRRAPIQLTAQWGWAAVPARIKEATLIAAEELYRMKDAPFGVAASAEWGVMRVRENPYVQSLIAPYRRYPVLVG